MKLVLNEHIFFEFVPFDDINFDSSGNIKENPTTLFIDQVEEGRDYAILMSTSAGAWRYLIGDTIRFVNLKKSEIIITGRTKHFLSLAGEHLSVDNMNRAIQVVSEKLNINVSEFTVAGIPIDRFFGHHWYIGTDDPVDKVQLREMLDASLKQLNDDYATERISVLKEIVVDVIPEKKFMEFMEFKGKVGGQHKFPRVMKGDMYKDWIAFLN